MRRRQFRRVTNASRHAADIRIRTLSLNRLTYRLPDLLTMHRVLLLGAGKIGRMIARFLMDSGDYELLVGDVNDAALKRVAKLTGADDAAHRCRPIRPNWRPRCKAADGDLGTQLPSQPARRRSGAEDRRKLLRSHRGRRHERCRRAKSPSAPPTGRSSCRSAGWRPASFRSSANDLINWFERIETVKMRVGALPQFPTGELKYNLTWSTDGLINEYCNPCEAIHAGKRSNCCRWKGWSIFARRRALRGVQHQRRPGHAVRYARRQGPRAELQNGPLHGPSRPDEVARRTSCG